MTDDRMGGAANAARGHAYSSQSDAITSLDNLERRYAAVLLCHGPDNDAPETRAARLRLLATRDLASDWRCFPEAHGADAMAAMLLAADTADQWVFSREARQVRMAAACVDPLLQAATRLDRLGVLL